MDPLGPVIVGVDGSRSALEAVDWAMDSARWRGVPLLIVHAFLWDRYQGEERSPDERVRKETLLSRAAQRAARRAPEVEVATRLVAQPPVTGLLHAALDASMVVVGSRGRGVLASLLLGSVGSGAAAYADCPVVTVRNRVGVRYGSRPRVAVGVPESEPRAAVMEFAFQEAERHHAELLAVRAWRNTENLTVPLAHGAQSASRQRHMRQAEETMEEVLGKGFSQHSEVHAVRRVVEGSARTVLLDASYGAELLVVGARGRQGRRGTPLTSLQHAFLHRAHCPVAIVPLVS